MANKKFNCNASEIQKMKYNNTSYLEVICNHNNCILSPPRRATIDVVFTTNALLIVVAVYLS